MTNNQKVIALIGTCDRRGLTNRLLTTLAKMRATTRDKGIYIGITPKYTNSMTTIKTAVSIEVDLFNQADELAEELQVSRSRLVSMALERLIKDYQTKKIVDKLNEVYADGPTEEDRFWMEQMAKVYAETLEEEEW